MKRNKLILKIVAFVAAVSLIIGIIVVANTFMGNPITAHYANKAIKNYVAEKYAHLDLEVSKAEYNFISSEYKAIAKSQTSIDTHFAIYYRGGMIKRDDYDSHVLSKFNTLLRLQNECSKLIMPILANVNGLENNTAKVTIENWNEINSEDFIKLDMPFDKSLPFDMKVAITAKLDDNSIDNIAAILKDAHKELTDHGYHFNSYDLYSESKSGSVTITEVSASDIESDNLKELLKDLLKNGDANEG